MTDIMRVVPKRNELGPYLLAFLLTPTGQALIRRGRTGTTVDHLSPRDLDEIDVVLVPEPERLEIAARVALAERQMDEARSVLDALDAELHALAGLGLPPPPASYFFSSGPRVFTMSASALTLRLDAAAYEPAAVACHEMVRKSGGKRLDRLARLRMLGRYRRYYVDADHGRPILSGRQILQIRPVNLRFISDRSFNDPDEFLLQKGWTIFTCDGRAEQALGTPAYVTSCWEGWMASNHVMRAEPRKGVHPGYLYLALRSPYVQVQLKSRATGSVVDALDPDAIADVQVPLLPSDHRKRLGERADRAWETIFAAIRTEAKIADELERSIVDGYERNARGAEGY